MSSIENTEQHAAWNGESGIRWVDRADERDRVLAPVAEVLVGAADLGSGMSVLDVGCGCGATTLAAASLLGDTGLATGVDLSKPMLQVARARAETASTTNVTFLSGDAQTHRPSEPVDLTISRFGTMFFSDPVAAFANLRDGLAPGGRLCLATWQPLEANEWLAVPGTALLGYSRLPDSEPDAPGMFAQSDPDTVRTTLANAGYRDIELDPVMVEFTVGDTVEEAAGYLAETGPGRLALESVADEKLDDALDAVRTALRAHTTDEGVKLGAGIWIIHATR